VQSLLDTLRLIRVFNCLLAMAGVWIGAHMTWLVPTYYGPLVASLAAFCVCAAGNVLNDIVDIEIDRINHPTRVLVRQALTVRFARWLTITFNLLAVALAVAVNWEVTAIVAGAVGLLVLYNLTLKKIALLGNVAVAFLAAFTFMTGGWAVDHLLAVTLPGPLIAAVFAFFFHLVREIVKDVQDIEGDRRAGYRSLPIRIGTSRSLIIAVGLFVILVLLTIVPVVTGWYGYAYEVITLYAVGLPLLAFLIFIWGNPVPRMLQAGSFALKAGMLLGLIALLIA